MKKKNNSYHIILLLSFWLKYNSCNCCNFCYHIICCNIKLTNSVLCHNLSDEILLLLLQIDWYVEQIHILWYDMISNKIKLYRIIPYHTISYYLTSYHIISYHIMAYYITSYLIIYYFSYHIISHHGIL